MRHRRLLSPTGLALALAIIITPRSALAQFEPLDEGIAVGAWTFYPSLELRVRGEYRRQPVDVGGDVYERTAVLADGFQSAAPPIVRRDPAVSDQWLASERARLGMRVEWELLRANLVLQDARVLGVLPGAPAQVDGGGMGTFEPYEAWLDLRDDVEDPFVMVRLGRQSVEWGDGRLVGDSDFAPRGGFFDALRMRLSPGPVDVELMAALLALPGAVPPPYVDQARQEQLDDAGQPANAEGTGAQLYGLDASYTIVPLFGIELTGLARIARDPLPAELVRSDTYVIDGRFYGDWRGVRYGVEGAYELGRVAGFGVNRDIRAFAVAGSVSWQTALPGDFRFAARGAYASGDDSNGSDSETITRFDPIAPDVRDNHGLAGLYGWSNLIEGAGEIAARPVDEVLLSAGYAFVGLAEPNDRWSTASLVAVGAAPDNTSHVLGHEVDVRMDVQPWSPLTFTAGYGLMVLGDGGEAILEAAGRGDEDLLHYGLVQAELKAP